MYKSLGNLNSGSPYSFANATPSTTSGVPSVLAGMASGSLWIRVGSLPWLDSVLVSTILIYTDWYT
jgi:hypothetical protein